MKKVFTPQTKVRGQLLWDDASEYAKTFRASYTTTQTDSMLMENFLLHKIAELELRIEALESKPNTII